MTASGARSRTTRSAGTPGDDGRVEAFAGVRWASGAGSAKARIAGLLQWLEPRAVGGQVRGAGEYRKDMAASQHDGHPGVPWTGMMAYSEDHIALAAEYALGTLDADERAQVETMMSVDKGFTAMVQAWEQKLGVLTQMVGSIEPRPEVWDKIRTARSEEHT